MKPLLLILLALTLTAVSCGGKDKGGSSSNAFTNQLSTQEGYINLSNQQAPIEVGGAAYPASNQQAIALINQAVYQAQSQGIQPINVNGQMKYRARITALIYDPYANQTNMGYNGYYNPYQSAQGTLQISSVVIY